MLKTWIKRSLIVGMGLTLLTPVVSHAFGEASVIENYVARPALVPLIKPSWGNFILHADILNKLYSLRGYQAVWVDSNGKPTSMAQMLRAILLTAERHGLNVGDYWDGDVENLYKAALANPKNWITFELAATEAMIRYVTHMSVGRFDPEQVDDDIKFKAKTFNEYSELNAAISYGPQSMPAALDNFAPTYKGHYAKMMEMLTKLRSIRTAGGWKQVPQSKVDLKTGVKNPLVLTLRARLQELGYNGGNLSSDVYDADFESEIRLFQEYNGMVTDGVVSGGSSGVINGLNISVNDRINQIVVNMEKLRWLPRNIEAKHIFVNLGMTEVRVFDESGEPKFIFNSVNGQPFRRTPSMRDLVTYVNLNPYWTTPRSIAIKDKLKELRVYGRSFLDDHDMVLISEATDLPVTDEEMRRIDWKNLNPKNFVYYIRQNPSVKNALGVVKFPLQNPWAIYLHDTNDRGLFKKLDRHQSSGCVRLEQAKDLALYLIEGSTTKIKIKDDWGGKDRWVSYTWDKYNLPGVLADGNVYGVANKDFWDVTVRLKEAVPVYMIYLTSVASDGGQMRFVKDPYGQDKRIEMAIKNARKTGETF